jgi:hypothetical protein
VGAMELVWRNVVAGGYLALLDGFSRFSFCSTEDRALTSVDLALYSSATSPTVEQCPRDSGDMPTPRCRL